LNFSTHNLKKLEQLIKEAGYELRYEKGSFNSGYCILQDKQVIVINKYFTPEVRFNKILDLIPQILSNFKPIKSISSLTSFLITPLNSRVPFLRVIMLRVSP
jgi:hypothetical protein